MAPVSLSSSPLDHIAKGASPFRAAGKANAAPAATHSATPRQQQTVLRQLLSQYSYGQTHGIAASSLANLRDQIAAAARTLGQTVNLPHAPAATASDSTQSRGAFQINLTV